LKIRNFIKLWNVKCQMLKPNSINEEELIKQTMFIIQNKNRRLDFRGQKEWFEVAFKRNLKKNNLIFNIQPGSVCLLLNRKTCMWTNWNCKTNEHRMKTLYMIFNSENKAKEFIFFFHIISLKKVVKQIIATSMFNAVTNGFHVIRTANALVLLRDSTKLFKESRIIIILKGMYNVKNNKFNYPLVGIDLKKFLIKNFRLKSEKIQNVRQIFIENTVKGEKDDFNGIEFNLKPIIKLNEQITNSGDSEDQIVFKDHSKVFRLDGKQWKERCSGLLTISKTKQGRFRIIQRDEITQKLRVHHYIALNQTIQIKQGKEKMLVWSGIDVSEDSKSCKTTIFCGKFQTIKGN